MLEMPLRKTRKSKGKEGREGLFLRTLCRRRGKRIGVLVLKESEAALIFRVGGGKEARRVGKEMNQSKHHRRPSRVNARKRGRASSGLLDAKGPSRSWRLRAKRKVDRMWLSQMLYLFVEN